MDLCAPGNTCWLGCEHPNADRANDIIIFAHWLTIDMTGNGTYSDAQHGLRAARAIGETEDDFAVAEDK